MFFLLIKTSWLDVQIQNTVFKMVIGIAMINYDYFQ